jgi:ribonuclease P/MRP protein subunit POP1
MHMVDRWGFRIVRHPHFNDPHFYSADIAIRQAEKPTEKCFRASYRASSTGCLLHDTSYFRHLQLTGAENDIKQILADICDPSAVSPSSVR